MKGLPDQIKWATYSATMSQIELAYQAAGTRTATLWATSRALTIAGLTWHQAESWNAWEHGAVHAVEELLAANRTADGSANGALELG